MGDVGFNESTGEAISRPICLIAFFWEESGVMAFLDDHPCDGRAVTNFDFLTHFLYGF